MLSAHPLQAMNQILFGRIIGRHKRGKNCHDGNRQDDKGGKGGKFILSAKGSYLIQRRVSLSDIRLQLQLFYIICSFYLSH